MAEAIGLAASVVTLAGLFSNCIDCFSFFKAAQNCSAEAETLLAKLDCEKARLLVWANTVGILCTDHQGRYPQLANLELEILIRRCIDQIISLLTDAQKLQAEYGSRPTAQREPQHYVAVVSVNSMNIFKTAKLRFFARAGGIKETPNWLSRIKWAIRDGSKFRILLLHLREFVDNIIQLVPVPLDVINDTVEEDITTMVDISTLRLAESACEESYPRWSTRASEVIKESEIGTLDRRNLEEIIRDIDEPETTKQESGSNINQHLSGKPTTRYFQEKFSGRLNVYFPEKTFIVLTDNCLDLEADSHCESATIGEAISGDKDLSFTCANRLRWNLGRRILMHVKLPFKSQEAMSEAESRRFELSKIVGELPDVSPVSRIYVHCGPCACAVQTALNLTRDNDASEFFEFVIRIDERLPTSCRRSSTTIDVLAAIRDTIYGHEVSWSVISKSIGFIDCPELEKRIYNLEQEKFGHFEPSSVLQKILVEDYQDYKNNVPVGAVVFIAEADSCQLSLESRPFRGEARKPRETEIFAFKSVWNESGYLWQREYMGSCARSANAIEKKRTRSSPITDLIPPPTSDAIATTPPIPRNKRPRSESTAKSDG
jgi:Prion-inhibition and propagation